ncbi:hypothetical protein EA138_09655 [Anoxybacillus flavithermus]|uniref:Uncharacterized protein n=1 Tax=Anoxybacillus flavithermus TaxID=33934 RepID=A0AAX2A0M3_9BACL|nr:hypothetical protein CA592_15030 [Anoxybacillus flavithermus]RWU12024.1 hypothetical protein EA138_09655 [Anoxybacillus flavithermus]
MPDEQTEYEFEVRYPIEFTEAELNRIRALIPTKNISYLDLTILYKIERAFWSLGEVYIIEKPSQ